MNKRLIALALASVLLFAACGGSDEGGEPIEGQVEEVLAAFALGFHQIIGVLQAQPVAFGQPEKTGKPQVRVRGNAPCAVDNGMDAVRRHGEDDRLGGSISLIVDRRAGGVGHRHLLPKRRIELEALERADELAVG